MMDTPVTEDQIPDELTITFRKPVVFATVTYETMTLREPTAGQWEDWDDLTGVAANRKALAVVSGLPEGAVKQLGVRDFQLGMAYLNRFF